MFTPNGTFMMTWHCWMASMHFVDRRIKLIRSAYRGVQPNQQARLTMGFGRGSAVLGGKLRPFLEGALRTSSTACHIR